MAGASSKGSTDFYKSKEATLHGFVRLTTWSCVLIAIVLAGMALFLT